MNSDLALNGKNGDVGAAQLKGLYVKTYGCQMNEYDSLRLAKLLEHDYRLVSDPLSADLILINTCSVRDKPERKLYSLLGELKELKRRKTRLIVGVGGCMAQRQGREITRRSTAVDFVFGTHNLSLVPALIAQRKKGMPAAVAVDYREDWEELPLGLPEGAPVSALIAVSRGCNKNCSFCVVPQTRGPEVSRAKQEILREVRMAVNCGAREVVLLGQTVNSYGRDLKPRQNFVGLLESLTQISGLERIRFTSPHPQEVRGDLIEAMAGLPKVCRHIHLPLQSGSDAVLRAMNRNYSRARYLEIIAALKEKMPDLAVTTDIIVGFPGENEVDFAATLDIMEAVEFDNSYSFVYSARPGTKAAGLADLLPYSAKLERLHVLQARQTDITARRLQGWIGKRVQVLLEEREEAWHGRIPQNFVLNLDQTPAALKPGMLVEAKVKSAARFTLKGELADPNLDDLRLIDGPRVF